MLKKIYFIFIMLFLLLFGCFNHQTPENAIKHIIAYYNNNDIEAFWNMVLPEDRYAVFKNMASNIDNYDLFCIMGYALNRDSITLDNLTAEEYLFGSFKIILGDKEMELINLEKIDDTSYSANVKLRERRAIIPLNFSNGKWYMRICNKL